MDKKVKTAVILAGGKGTRMREHPIALPKPMVEIGGKPVLYILWIIKFFQSLSSLFVPDIWRKLYLIILKKCISNVTILPTGDETQTGENKTSRRVCRYRFFNDLW